MSFGTFIGEFSGSAKKADSTKHDDKDDKEKEKKDGEGHEQQKTSDNTHQTSEHSSFLGSIWGETMDGIHNVYNYFAGDKNDPNLPKATVTDAQGRPVDKDGNVIKDGTVVKDGVNTKDVAENIAVKPVDAPVQGNPWDYDSWWNVYQTQEQKKAPEPSVAEKVANWVGDKWDRLFGKGKAGEFETTDDKGHKATTTMSEKGVDHVTDDGTKTHTDGRGIVQKTAEGDVRYVDKTNGTTGETYRNGTDVHRNADGSFDVTRDGSKVHVNSDGTIDETVNGHRIKIDKDRVEHLLNRFKIRQHRHGDNGTGEQEQEASQPTDGKPTITAVEDKDDHSQMIVINDGHGNTVKLRRNGERILSSKDNPDVEIIANKDDDNVRLRAYGKDYFLKRQEGTDNQDRWYVYSDKEHTGSPVGWIDGNGSVYKYDENDPTKVGQKIGQVQGLNGDGSITNGTASIGPNGEVRMQGNASNVEVTNGNNVRITGPDGTTVVSRDGQNGETSTVTNTNPEGVSDATSTNPADGSTVTKNHIRVDSEGKAITDPSGKPEGGDTVVAADTGPDGKPRVTAGLGDVDGDGKEDTITGTQGDKGFSWLDSFGTVINEVGDMCTAAGDWLYHTGAALFSDGTSVDENGNVSSKGKYVGSAGGYGAESEYACAARVSAILSIASSISSSTTVDPGKIGQLMALYAELGNAQGMALQTGDMGAFMQADLAKATVSGAISEQQAAQARQEMGKYFSEHPLNNDQLAQLQNSMRGGSPDQVRDFMKNSGWISDQREPVPAR